MSSRSTLVGRREERERLEAALRSAQHGGGSLVLLAGEAGVGKTRLAAEIAQESGLGVLWGLASHGAAAPYGPLVAALRAGLRVDPEALDAIGPMRPHLALLLPELGDPAPVSDRATLFEALHCAFAQIARDRDVLVVLDDLQWSDEATLELLPALAEALSRLPLLVLAAYRSDGLPRDHKLRRLRYELRRAGRLDELAIAPLDAAATAELLGQLLDGTPAPSLARAIHDRTKGVPFFVEELARALVVTGSVADGRRGLELADGGEVPLPDTVRDAVLIGVAELSPAARAAADAAAVAGERFELDIVAGVAGADGVAELLERGLVTETGAGGGAFRHALSREALYADVPWLQRRALHRRLAEALESAGASSVQVAPHWLGAHDSVRAREALLRAAAESHAVHAHRDAAWAVGQALELWPEGQELDRRADALAAYATSAELAGELAGAGRALRELCDIHTERGARAEHAAAHRRLAAIHDLRGEREAAFAARSVAAEGFAAAGRPADAAVERLALANHLRLGAGYSAAIELARSAVADAERAGRLDLRLRARGLEGVALARRGDFERGLATVRNSLAQALEHDLTPVAAELYQRLSLVLYDAADYPRAQETLDTALALCEAVGEPVTEVACVSCLVYVLRERGEWGEAVALGRDLIARGDAVWVAEGLIGAIYGAQGKLGAARRLLTSSYATAAQAGHFHMAADTTIGLARLAAAEGAGAEAAERCRALLARWERSEDRHYAVKGLRWAAAFLARSGDLAGTHACAEALTRIASETGHADALAALAHAIGETALADGDVETAAVQIGHAVELHRGLDLPWERVEIELRAGVALAAAGERELGLERLGEAYRGARRLGARPLAAEAAREVAALGESVVARLGSRAAGAAGLSPRELEVVRLVAVGRTNREVAQQLYLSPRTVDMHVRNILRKLDCSTRVEAAHRATELGLLAGSADVSG